jgi:toxin HigB-1
MSLCVDRRHESCFDSVSEARRCFAPGEFRLHPLRANLKGHWAVMVSGNWRLTFRFEGEDAILADYQDYH